MTPDSIDLWPLAPGHIIRLGNDDLYLVTDVKRQSQAGQGKWQFLIEAHNCEGSAVLTRYEDGSDVMEADDLWHDELYSNPGEVDESVIGVPIVAVYKPYMEVRYE
jgi:hypothetical protein